MPSCALRYCKNYWGNTNKSVGVAFHKFPRPSQIHREAWIKFVQKNRSEETWLPSDFSCICSVHFKDNDKYTTKSGLKRLKNTAVPCEDPITPDEKDDEEPLSVGESSSDSIFDTPKEIFFKLKLQKESAARKNLAAKYKKLQQQNIYLKKKNESYKKIVRILKSKTNANCCCCRKSKASDLEIN